MKKVIVAGATGYLGRFVVQESKKEAIRIKIPLQHIGSIQIAKNL